MLRRYLKMRWTVGLRYRENLFTQNFILIRLILIEKLHRNLHQLFEYPVMKCKQISYILLIIVSF